MLKILRLEQWTKNLILFIPPFLGKNYLVLFDSIIYIVFLGFSLIVSATYIFNDLKDIEQDKQHPEKKFRPLASGRLTEKSASIYSIVLASLGFALIIITKIEVLLYVGVYVIITISYSIKLKYLKYLDFLSITILFALRFVIGGIAGNTELSNFLIIFILAFLTQISLGKKLSIYKDPNITPLSKVKSHLKQSYKLNELDSILKFTFIISNIIFFLWAFERWDGSAFQGFISLVAIFLLIYFDLKFMSDSKNYKTENFIIWIIESKLIFIAILISILVLVITF